MFTWICPTCGREVPPSYTECPDCAPAQQAAPPAQAAPPHPPQVAPPPPPPPVYAAPPPPPPQPVYAAPPPAAPPVYAAPPPSPTYTSPLFAPAAPAAPMQAAPMAEPRGGLPTWAMSILFTLAFLGLGAGIYWVVQHLQGGGASTSATAGKSAGLENVPAAKGQAAAQPNPMQKYVEVVGLRFLQNTKKQTEARFVLVNHSSAEAADLSGTVSILGRTQKEGDEPVGRFSFKGITLGPYESKEASAPLDTKLRVYELPDWQMTVVQVQLTSP